MSTEVDRRVPPRSLDEEIEKTKTLICALNLVSRDLPLPPHLLASVSSIFYGADGGADDDDGAGEGVEAESASSKDVPGMSSHGDLIMEFEDALLNQRETCSSGQGLTELRDNRFLGRVEHRLSDLEELPSSRGEDLQTKCLLELYGLKLKALQKKVRSDVSSEYWLRASCACPDKQLYDWGMMRLRDIQYGIGDAFVEEGDDQLRKKRDAERLSRLQDEEKNYMETRKRKFFADLLNAAREINVQVGAMLRHRKARNDGVQGWHVRQRQKATRQEKLRIQAIKARDEETYMKLVNESKNERLTTLLGKTNELLESLGAAVQRQKDAEHSDGTEPSKIDMTAKESVKAGNIFEGQRQYNSAVHSIQEKVTEQPAMLQGGELRPYQVEGLQWMVSLFNNNLNGILADEMGLGKTIQTISLIAYLLENKGVTGPHLIVAPKAVLPNWKNEFATWAPTIHTVLYDGRKEERSALQQKYSGEEKFNVFLTHYDLIIRDKKFLKKIHWYYMVVDEGHRLKNHDCTLARTLVSGYKIRRRLLLTGTPIQNSLQELWALLNFLLPNIFNSVDNFEEWFNAPFADRGDITLTEEEEQLIILRLHHVIRPFILRRKKEEVEKYLPQKTQVILKCDMSAWQKVYYHQITDIGRVGLATASRKSKSLQNLSMQLRKCCNHPYLFVGDPSLWHIEELIRASGKFELLDRLLPKLRRAGHRVLLFSQMTKLLDVLQFYLRAHKYDYLRLDGSSKTEDRGELLKKFNAPNSPYFIFLLSTRAGGLGLNLQTADTVIIFDSDWNPQMDQQAEDRAHRIGQTKEVRVFVLVSVGSIEEVILERAKQKMGIDAKVIQAGLFNTTSTAEERRGLLEEIMRKGTSSLGTDVPSEREINRLAARTEEEYWLFERMDEERRLRENYRTRLMEEHEVPDWAYTTPDVNDTKGKGFDYESANITGKRKRKEVGYSDILNDAEWYKAMQSADGTSNSMGKGEKKKKKEKQTPLLNSHFMDDTEDVSEENDDGMISSERSSDETPVPLPKKIKVKKLDSPEYKDNAGSSRNGSILTWKTHKKKRSSFTVLDSKGQSSGGKSKS